MTELVVALSIDKVQAFLTEVIHAHTQEKQAEGETLSKIRNASREISAGFTAAIDREFDGKRGQVLLVCSGVYIFTSTLPEAAVRERINRLFTRYYLQSGGQKQLKGVCFPRGDLCEIKLIQEAKKRLKENKGFCELIEANRNVLFSFQKLDERKSTVEKEDFPQFAETINNLFCKEKSEEDYNSNSNHFRIAVIKADLDGMGHVFSEARDYEEYRAISKTLNDLISLRGLHEAAQNCGMAQKENWLFPFYIAGDDIFFAVEITNLINGINVCRELLRQINVKLSQLPKPQKLSLSIGVDITFNREPVRYYMERAEEQLSCAKKAEALKELAGYCNGKIAIFDMAYYDINVPKLKKYEKQWKARNHKKTLPHKRERENTPIWQDLLNDLCQLDKIREEQKDRGDKIGTAHFFNALLKRLTEKTAQTDCVKYANCLLYHLLPQYLDYPNETLREQELTLHYNIVRQINRLERDIRNPKKNQNRLCVTEQTKQRLEAYLRIMLLFSDQRFDLTKSIKNGKAPHETVFDADDVRRGLLNRTVSFLYEPILKGQSEGLRDIFIQRNSGRFTSYRILKIDSSMFFKLRDMDRVSLKKAADMIELNNPATSEMSLQVKEHNEVRKSAGKVPNRLCFDKESFLTLAKKPNIWTPDFVDSMMLFYAYNEASIQFKGRYPKKEQGGQATCKK